MKRLPFLLLIFTLSSCQISKDRKRLTELKDEVVYNRDKFHYFVDKNRDSSDHYYKEMELAANRYYAAYDAYMQTYFPSKQ